MSAQELVTQARRADDPRTADALATRAILADPDHGPAYGLRGALAARRGDPIVAAHYFRVAYARGDRSEATRAGLAACLDAAGEAGVAGRIRAGARLPPPLADFAEGLPAHAGPLRQVLSARLPPAGQPAFLPGEKPPGSTGGHAPIRPRASNPRVAPPEARRSLPGVPAPAARSSSPRIPAPEPRASAPRVPADPPARVVRRADRALPDWLEPTHFETAAAAPSATPDWLEDATPRFEGGAFTGGGIELTADPGVPTVRARSPVTGLLIDEQSVARERQGAVMPDLGRPEDPLEARPALLSAVDDPAALRLAVRLPGPVVTAAGGQSPRKLAEQVALGVLPDELVLRDPSAEGPPARVPLRAVARLEVLDDGAQLALHLHDRRQMHLDLRDLRQRAPFVANRLIDTLAEALEGPPPETR